LIVTKVPAVPLVGVNDEITGTGGGGTTVKSGVPREVVSAVPPGVVTIMGPWLLPGASTVARIWVAESDLITAAVPAMLTDEALFRFDPLMVTCVPGGPLVGVKPLMAGVDVTVKETLLVAVPLGVVTFNVPLVVPFGTVVLI
jgi:hypothetical protein